MGYYALVKEDNTVTDIVVWDGVSTWTPPSGHTLVDVTDMDVGTQHTYDPTTQTFIEFSQEEVKE